MPRVSTKRPAIFAVAALAALAFAPSAQAAKICPLFLVKACVFNNKTHQIFTTETNQCLAGNAGLTVIYTGACKCGAAMTPKG